MKNATTIICKYCTKKFDYPDYKVRRGLKLGQKWGIFCNMQCQISHKKENNLKKTVNCKQCNKIFTKDLDQIKKTKNNNFCNSSCAAKYNNKHKKHGTRRSKLEIYIDQKLKEMFPYLEYECNKLYHGYEFDFMFPTLSLAIEINGIFHREPIYGEEKLKRTQKRDREKKKICKKHGIKLIILEDKKNFSIKNANKLYCELVSSRQLEGLLSYL